MTTHKTLQKGKLPKIPPPNATETYNAVAFDYDAFKHFLDGSGWTEEEKKMFLQKYWDIICDFVAIGFEVHSVQQACGQVSETAIKATSSPTSMVKSVYQHLSPQLGTTTDSAPLEMQERDAP